MSKMWTWLLYVVMLLVGLKYFESWLKHKEFEKIPGPEGIFLLANSLDFLMDPVKLFYYFRTLANKYKSLFKLKFGSKKVVVLYNPEDCESVRGFLSVLPWLGLDWNIYEYRWHTEKEMCHTGIQEVLNTGFDFSMHYSNKFKCMQVVLSGTKHNSKGFMYRFLKPWLQDGLLLSDGTKWQQRRKILTPTFHFNILRHFHPIIEEDSRNLADSLQGEVGKPKTDVSAFITDFTLNSICETAMGTKLDGEEADFGKRYKEGIHTLGQTLVYRAQRLWMYPNWVFPLTYVGKKQKEMLKLLSSFRDSVINKRKETVEFDYINVEKFNNDGDELDGKKRLAMLDLLLQAEKEGIIDAKGIGEEVDTFMFEGHDTTATALQFAFMLIANHPEAQEKIVNECQNIFGSSDRVATMNDLSLMKYLECCIKEAMRLYPPVHFIMRKFQYPVKLKNFEVPAGTECTILVYDLHRRADQFVEPLEFKPERFLGAPTWHPYSYIPFSAGPRNCIGQKYAMMEMKLALSAVLRRYRLMPVTRPRDLILITDFILRPRHQIYVKFEDRFVNSNNPHD